jgi:AraC family transcriptional regulator, glycine betaine-responsive activator
MLRVGVPVPSPKAANWRPMRSVGIYIAPQFSMISLMCAIEPLRVANEALGRPFFSWELISRDGGRVRAVNGLDLMTHKSISDGCRFDMMMVCASYDLKSACDSRVLAWLRRLARHGFPIGAVDTGTYLLAMAGLLDGYRCTIHWQNLDAFRADFPDIQATSNLYEIDRNRFSCSGATAALDLMLHLIAMEYGADLKMKVSEQLVYERLHHQHNDQRSSVTRRLQTNDPRLGAAVSAMEKEIETPLSIGDVGRLAGVTIRQLERLFEQKLGCSPKRYYADLRLARARTLLHQTSLAITEVATTCGFPSYAHFSRSYKRLFGCSPTAERRRPYWGPRP